MKNKKGAIFGISGGIIMIIIGLFFVFSNLNVSRALTVNTGDTYIDFIIEPDRINEGDQVHFTIDVYDRDNVYKMWLSTEEGSILEIFECYFEPAMQDKTSCYYSGYTSSGIGYGKQGQSIVLRLEVEDMEGNRKEQTYTIYIEPEEIVEPLVEPPTDGFNCYKLINGECVLTSDCSAPSYSIQNLWACERDRDAENEQIEENPDEPYIPINPYCGDGTCDLNEDSIDCPEDCGEPRTRTPLIFGVLLIIIGILSIIFFPF